MTPRTSILAFYAFKPLKAESLAERRLQLLNFGKERDMRGLVLLATEGINGTVCGNPEAVSQWRALIAELFPDATWNESDAGKQVFPRWLVKIREEIVALGMPESMPQQATHLTPAEWHTMLDHRDAVVIDARNVYETQLGMFEGAIDPEIEHFQDFPAFAEQCDVPKDKKVLLYCTGGIRCEKAVTAMKNSGYSNVFQLKGGILSYLKEFPDAKFRGECFVFDHRVAVDQRLQPSATYRLCAMCGDPGTENASCAHCSSSFRACSPCVSQKHVVTCSKNCAYHHERAKSLTGTRRP